MPYLGYLLAQAVKAGQSVASALTSAASFVTRVGSSVVELSASAEAVKSPSNGSAVFNGTGDYIGFNTPFLSGTQDFSLSAWIYPEVFSGGDTIIANYGTGNLGGFQFYCHSSGTLSIYINGYTNTTLPSVNTWYYVTATRSGTAISLYVNGNLAASNTTSHSITTSLNARIGTNASGGEIFDGNMCNVAVWSRALTAEEIRSVMMKSYDELNASETKGLVSWYALDDISGTTVPDSHGNFNGTAY